jgi:hypothetical protein
MKSRVRITQRMAAGKGNSNRREIPEDFKYNKRKLKPLKRILHNVNVALGTLVSAHNEFSRIKGPDISPDGMVGGLGYILPIKDVKEALNVCIRSLSDVSDSLADEMTNPHWGAEEDNEVKKLIKEKEEVEEQVNETEEALEESDEPSEESDEPSEESDGPSEESDEPKKKDDPDITPQDIITSRDFENKKATDENFFKFVQESLVRFSSIGKQKNITKE